MRRQIIILTLLLVPLVMSAQSWPRETLESRAGARWWWLGSAVNEADLRWNMMEYEHTGIGTLEITPIYGVQGNRQNELIYLSTPWMNALKFVQTEGMRDSILIDMNNGTGWPFGGPQVPLEEAACKVVIVKKSVTGKECHNLDIRPADKKGNLVNLSDDPAIHLCRVMAFGDEMLADITSFAQNGTLKWKGGGKQRWTIYALYYSRTRQKVKRAAPGGEGLVIDHFDPIAVKHYLARFDSVFVANGASYPHSFFNDSYEVYGANWTPKLLDEFEKRRGYKLEDHLPELLGDKDDGNQTLSDYRETLSDLLLENFTLQWVEWAHRHGSTVRNQAHGSPANLIDLYAAVDIPEIEGFGLTDFHIKGLRRDPDHTRPNYSDLSMLKYASSAAHVTGKPLTSSETFTWLTEHFRTSLSQMKPDLDLMFASGVNRMFFHGTCYSPKDDPWPGWKFYASIDMSPTNTIWRDAPWLMKYISRCQSWLQSGKPDNDFLVLLPVRDMWREREKEGTAGLLMQFDIHSMARKAPDFIRSILTIDSLGFDCDYISEKLLLGTAYTNGRLQTAAGTRYKALIIPGSGRMNKKVKAHIDSLRALGASVIWGCDTKKMLLSAVPEAMKTDLSLHSIRRTDDNGYFYFIANLTPNDINAYTSLSVPFTGGVWFNPLNGDRYAADIADGKIRIALLSGQSMILRVSSEATPSSYDKQPLLGDLSIPLDQPWRLRFIESVPSINATFALNAPQTWETLSDSAGVLMGTGVYTTQVSLTREEARHHWAIDLGDVRESARVSVNGRSIGCAWAAPFILDCYNTLQAGNNTIRVEVTNLPANRIAKLDRDGVKWRKFNEINVVDINYKKTTYADWSLTPSGLNSDVKLICYE